MSLRPLAVVTALSQGTLATLSAIVSPLFGPPPHTYTASVNSSQPAPLKQRDRALSPGREFCSFNAYAVFDAFWDIHWLFHYNGSQVRNVSSSSFLNKGKCARLQKAGTDRIIDSSKANSQ